MRLYQSLPQGYQKDIPKMLLTDTQTVSYTHLDVYKRQTLYNGYTDTMDKMLRRLRYDLFYLQHRSWWLDVYKRQLVIVINL